MSSAELFYRKLQQTDSFILVSHDRSILDRLCNKIIEIRDSKLEFYSGNYSFYLEQSQKIRKRVAKTQNLSRRKSKT